MLQRLTATVLAVILCGLASPALARGHGGGHHSYGGGHRSYGGSHRSYGGSHRSYGGSHRSYGGRIYGFRTSKCKSAACFRKHPNGTYVHPLTERKRR
jgi:hypothetical protein